MSATLGFEIVIESLVLDEASDVVRSQAGEVAEFGQESTQTPKDALDDRMPLGVGKLGKGHLQVMETHFALSSGENEAEIRNAVASTVGQRTGQEGEESDQKPS